MHDSEVHSLRSSVPPKVKLSAAEKAAALVEGTPGAKLYANEPYYQPGEHLYGKGLPATDPAHLPKYMLDELNPWWPKVDCSDILGKGDGRRADCYPSWTVEKMKADPRVRWADEQSKANQIILDSARRFNEALRLILPHLAFRTTDQAERLVPR